MSVRRGLSAACMRLLALLALVSAAGTALATTYHARTPEQMALAADMLFVGTVEDQSAVLVDGEPWTEVSFSVERWLAQGGLPAIADGAAQGGAELPAAVTLRFLGGALPGGQTVTVSGLPQLRLRERVLVFAYDDPGLASPVVGVSQGVWTLDARGARSGSGTYLTVGDDGRLRETSTGSGLEELLAALDELLAAGTVAKPEPEPGPASDTPEEPLPEPTEPEAPAADSDAASAGADPNAALGDQGRAEDGPADPERPSGAGASGAAEGTAAQAAPSPSALEAVQVRYLVNESGGPLLLSDAVARAALAWTTAAPGAVAFTDVSDDDGATAAAHTVMYGRAELFGPDALSFTIVRGGSSTTEVHVSPLASRLLDEVLVHELGVLIGLPEGRTGVMASAVTAGASTPTGEDVVLLQELRTHRAEDLNRDGVVDFYDLAILAEAFGARGVNLAADINGDGVVNELDLALLEAAYQFLPPSEQQPAGP